MCGIAGVLNAASGEKLEVVRQMADALLHRGPDSAGYWREAKGRVSLGHRRLSIVDLSAAGAQPMHSASGRFVIAFNGEIYNHADLRRELELAGTVLEWRGHSDTETLLAAFERWGIRETLRRSVGMFGLALWDAREEALTLARDRFGEKPLYYGWGDDAGAGFAFASELKALRVAPGFGQRICRDALAQYMRLLYVPAPRTIYKGVFKLEPGCMLTVRGVNPSRAPQSAIRPGTTHENVTVERWWSLAEVVTRGAADPFTTESEAIAALEASLLKAIRQQSIADVPLGAFLSGGVDSSTIAALMQRQSTKPVKTFTVGFEDSGFDESASARAIAQHLGTDHHDVFVTAAEVLAVIPHLPAIYDEPFADSSQIPTHLVCRAARSHVTVALSGDAGDEMFGGYNRYFWAPRIWRHVSWIPRGLREGFAAGLRGPAPATWDRVLGRAGVRRPGEKLHKLGRALRDAGSIDDLYENLVAEWPAREKLVLGASSDGAALQLPPTVAGLEDARLRMMYWDAMTYLPDDILCKVDRAAMATSLETRVPFLDPGVVETAWRLPASMKIRENQGKWALRQILYQHVPRKLIDRPKTGFAIPVGQWLRGPLRDWAEHLLSGQRLRAEGFLRPEPIERAWSEHLAGRKDRTPALWAVLMFQAWLERNGSAG